jgi:hypothetical protein
MSGAAEIQLTIAQVTQVLFNKSKTLFALIRTFGFIFIWAAILKKNSGLNYGWEIAGNL